MLQESIYNSSRSPRNVASCVFAEETDRAYRFVSLY